MTNPRGRNGPLKPRRRGSSFVPLNAGLAILEVSQGLELGFDEATENARRGGLNDVPVGERNRTRALCAHERNFSIRKLLVSSPPSGAWDEPGVGHVYVPHGGLEARPESLGEAVCREEADPALLLGSLPQPNIDEKEAGREESKKTWREAGPEEGEVNSSRRPCLPD